jgi:hypothetical protein
MRITVAALAVLFAAGTAQAQSFTPRLLGQVAGKKETKEGDFKKIAQPTRGIAEAQETKKAEERTEATAGAGLAILSQADVLVDNKDAQVGLQALDLFFNKDWRLYVRSTLPVPDDDTAGSGDGSNDDSNTPAAVTKLTSSAIAALVDPYGGVLNLSTGSFHQIPIGRVPDGEERDPDHGLFVDARFGLKLVNLPDQAEDSPALLNTSVSPFYSGALMVKVVKDVYGSADGKESAGGFEFGIGGVIDIAADKSASKAFENGLLEETTTAIRCDVALSLKSIAAITVSWTPWSSNETFGKRFVVGLKLLNQSPIVK